MSHASVDFGGVAESSAPLKFVKYCKGIPADGLRLLICPDWTVQVLQWMSLLTRVIYYCIELDLERRLPYPPHALVDEKWDPDENGIDVVARRG